MVRSSVLRLLVCLASLAAVVLLAFSQTKLDLQHQARGIDFTGSTYTKPVRMGSALPSTCTTGEGYLLSSAPAGSNLYFCLSPNVWILQGGSGGSGSSGAGVVNSLATTTNGTLLTIGSSCTSSAPCNVRLGSTVYAFTNQAVASLGGGSGTAYVYVDQNGVLTVGYSGISLNYTSGCTPVNGITSWPASALPLASISAASGAWGAVTDLRAPLSRDNTPATSTQQGSVVLPASASSNLLGSAASGVQAGFAISITQPPYNAACDGVTDDATAINAATHDYKLSSGYYGNVQFHLPTGDRTCLIGSPINLYSGQFLVGFGATLKAASFSGSYEIGLQPDGNGYFNNGGITGVTFDDSATPGLVAVQAVAADVVGSTFSHLTFNTHNGVLCTTYCQTNTFDHFMSQGPIDTLLAIYGNFNRADTIVKEGSTGSALGCYIQIGATGTATQSDDNYLTHVLVENVTSANKCAVAVTNATGTVITDVWNEGTASNGYIVMLKTTNLTSFKGRLGFANSGNTIGLVSSTDVSFDKLDISGYAQSFYSMISVDSASTFTGPSILQTRYNQDSFPATFLAFGGGPQQTYSSALLATPAAGYSPVNQYRDQSGSNLLVNGSFEAGNYGWTWDTAANLTQAFVQSAVDQGLMGNFVWSGSGNYGLYQSITVPAAQVGQTMSLSAQVYVIGTISAVSPYLSGAGITISGSYSQATITGQWETVSIQFVPQSAGTIRVGLWFIGVANGTVANVDDITLSFGTVGQRYSNKFQSLELAGKVQTYAPAAPSSGTWTQGAIVYNTTPVEAGTPGSKYIQYAWICVASGSPGQWLSLRALDGN
jgi:hypothetical protein